MECCESIRRAIGCRNGAAGPCKIILKLPTGAGKTLIAWAIIDYVLGCRSCVGFTTPRISLIEQSVRAFEKEGTEHIGVIQGSNKRADGTAPIQVISVATLKRRAIEPLDLMIVDESHVNSRAIYERMDDPAWANCRWVGLSATPWTVGLGKHYDRIIQGPSIQDLSPLQDVRAAWAGFEQRRHQYDDAGLHRQRVV